MLFTSVLTFVQKFSVSFSLICLINILIDSLASGKNILVFDSFCVIADIYKIICVTIKDGSAVRYD